MEKKAKLLLHVCCGPCAEYPLAILQEDYEVSLFFYNPNIHPLKEWYMRLEGVIQLAEIHQVPLIVVSDYEEELWASMQDQPARRCRMCYSTRMRATALEAAQRGFDFFTTSLLVSPYQQHDLIRELAEEGAADLGVDFLYQDFRPGFREGQNMAREDGLYRQRFCGCICSFKLSKFQEWTLAKHALYQIPEKLSQALAQQTKLEIPAGVSGGALCL